MNEWKSSGGRITLFPAAASSPPLSALALYKHVWGEEPDGFQKQTNPLSPSVAHGRRGSLVASCLAQPTRIDFNLIPPTPTQDGGQDAQTEETPFPLIKDTNLLHAELLRAMEVINRSTVLNSVVRVALGVQFLALEPSSSEANKVLVAIIPRQYGVRVTNEEDFIFQVNQPYTSLRAEGVKVNSITKWSVDRLQILTLALPANQPATSSQAAGGSQATQFIAASVQFDINNVATGTPLPSGQPASLLNEALLEVSRMQFAMGLNIEGFQDA